MRNSLIIISSVFLLNSSDSFGYKSSGDGGYKVGKMKDSEARPGEKAKWCNANMQWVRNNGGTKKRACKALCKDGLCTTVGHGRWSGKGKISKGKKIPKVKTGGQFNEMGVDVKVGKHREDSTLSCECFYKY